MVKCLNIGKNIGKPIYRSISSLNTIIIVFTLFKMGSVMFSNVLIDYLLLSKATFYLYSKKYLTPEGGLKIAKNIILLTY